MEKINIKIPDRKDLLKMKENISNEAENIDIKKIRNDRNAWLNMEKHIFKAKPKYYRNEIDKNIERDAYDLYKEIISLIEEIESGKLEDEEIKENVEKITILFAAIRDNELESLELERRLIKPTNELEER